MMEFNLTQTIFIFIGVAYGLLGLLITLLGDHVPVLITRTFRYGKFAVIADHTSVWKSEVPKRWFEHFYKFAATASSVVLALTVSEYIYNRNVANIAHGFLDLLFGTQRKALVSPESTLLAMILLTIQCWKRLYETHCVSVFSDRKMNLALYIIGFVHYIGAISCIIGESEGFVRGSSAVLHWNRVTTLQYVCAIIFLWASFEQLQTNYILAKLRKNKSGAVVTNSYKIPYGRLFDYISAPLQLTEIIMYTMLSIILWRSLTYHYVCFWVLVNQVVTAEQSHSWYLATFKNYPKHRNILIPNLL